MNVQKKQPVNLARKRLANISLSNTESSVILGGLLGDGSLKLYSGYKNARYSMRHSSVHSAYFWHKCELLKNCSTPKSAAESKPDGWSKRKKLRFQSAALAALTEIWKVTHKNNAIVVRRVWLNHLTAHSLAIWWFDDGSIVGGGRRGVLCTDGFTKSECEILKKYLFVVWKVTVRLGPVKESGRGGAKLPNPRIYYRLWLATSQLQKFLQIVIPYLPTVDLIYKCKLKYKSVNFQERWISQIEPHCPPNLRDQWLAQCRERE